MGVYGTTIGPLLLGTFISTYLFGLVSFQFITYYTSGFKDPLWIRAMVVITLVTDVLHSASLIYMAWVYCVVNFMNPKVLQSLIWPYPLAAVVNAFLALITHFFLGYRIYRLTQMKFLFHFIYISAFALFIMGSMVGIRAWMIDDLNKLSVLSKLGTCWLSLETALELFTASIMVICLYRSRSPYRQTNTVIYRLMRVAIQTGIFCSIFVMGELIAFLAFPRTNIDLIFAFPLGRIYTNTLMDTLNMRGDLRDSLNATRTGGLSNEIDLSFGVPPSSVATDAERNRTSLVIGEQKAITSMPSTDFPLSKSRLDRELVSEASA